MVYTKVLQIKSVKNLTRAVDYILNEDKVLLPLEEFVGDFPFVVENGQAMAKITSGHLIASEQMAADEFILTKKLADHRLGRTESSDLVTGKGVLAHHIIQSFSPEDNLTPEEAHAIGRQTILELVGDNHEFVMATHLDRGHIHNHIIFNSTNASTLKKFRWQKNTKRTLEKISDRYADLAGAKIIDKQPVFNHTAYQAYRQKNVFRLEIKNRLNFLLKHSTSLEDFLAKAKVLNLHVDVTGKYVTYRLLDKYYGKEQKRNVRDSTLSKKGAYSLETIEKRVKANSPTLSLVEIKEAYDQEQAKRAGEFEFKLTIEPWQIAEVTKTGIYLNIDFGIRNQGVIQIPHRMVDQLDNGNYDLFIKEGDFFYFLNPDKSQNNRYMKGSTLIKQLAHDNGEYILRKHPKVSKLEQLVEEFNFLSKHGVSDSIQFEELGYQLLEQLAETERTLDRLDEVIAEKNKILAALTEYQTDDPDKVVAALHVLEEANIEPQTSSLARLEKELVEISVERTTLKEKYDSIVKDFDQYEQMIEHVKQRRAEKEQDKSGLGL